MTPAAFPVLLVKGPVPLVVALVDDAAVLPVTSDSRRALVDGLDPAGARMWTCLLACHPAVLSVEAFWSVAGCTDPSRDGARHRLRRTAARAVVVDEPGFGVVEHVLFRTGAEALAAARAAC